jgi:hypothetical protein
MFRAALDGTCFGIPGVHIVLSERVDISSLTNMYSTGANNTFQELLDISAPKWHDLANL